MRGNAHCRRRFLACVMAMGAAPLVRAQGRERVYTLGYLGARLPAALREALGELGYAEGRNFRIVVRAAPAGENPAHAAGELVAAAPDVLITGGAPRVAALARATATIPIVSLGSADPVGDGVARSLRQPGTNVTGLSFGLPDAARIQLGTLRALVPRLKRVVFITAEWGGNTEGGRDPGMTRPAPAHEAAARELGMSSELSHVEDLKGVERLLATLHPATDAAWVATLPPDSGAPAVAAAALRRRIATHGRSDEEVRAGFLLSCWLEHTEPMKRVAAIIDKILRGESPARIPIETPDKSRITLNRRTATTLGLRVTPDVLLRATEVID